MADLATLHQPATPSTPESGGGSYRGLRMTADQFFQIPDDGCNYELIDGVVQMSPSATPLHQAILCQVVCHIYLHLRDREHLGHVFMGLHVHLGRGPTGTDLVYRPDVIFIRAERWPEVRERITGPPDLVVEIVSPDSRRMDHVTKRDDYERCGVREYWLLDPERNTITCHHLADGRFTPILVEDETFPSKTIPDFTFDIAGIRETFKGW